MNSIYVKLIALALVLAAFTGTYMYGHHKGAQAVQAKWDAAKIVQREQVAKAKVDNATKLVAWKNKFTDINTKYEAVLHAQPKPIADSVAADVSAGRLKLRDSAACPSAMSRATARARAADAAATAVLSQRVQDSIAIVRVAEHSDNENKKLRAQVIGLQSILRAERNHGTE